MLTLRIRQVKLCTLRPLLGNLFRYMMLKRGLINSPSLTMFGVDPKVLDATIDDQGVTWHRGGQTISQVEARPEPVFHQITGPDAAIGRVQRELVTMVESMNDPKDSFYKHRAVEFYSNLVALLESGAAVLFVTRDDGTVRASTLLPQTAMRVVRLSDCVDDDAYLALTGLVDDL